MGSMFKSPKQPDPINVGAIAAQANQQNVQNAQQTAAYNRVNQRDAMGNTLNYSQSGTDANGNPIFQANQQLGEAGQMYAGGLAGLGKQYFDTAGQGGGDSKGAFDQAYGYASANLEPRMQRQADAKYTQLRNQGLDPTSEAFKSSTNDLALQQNEARNNLVTQALSRDSARQASDDPLLQLFPAAPALRLPPDRQHLTQGGGARPRWSVTAGKTNADPDSWRQSVPSNQVRRSRKRHHQLEESPGQHLAPD